MLKLLNLFIFYALWKKIIIPDTFFYSTILLKIVLKNMIYIDKFLNKNMKIDLSSLNTC